MKIICVFGTRPEAIKMIPLIKALENSEIETIIVSSGQHSTLLEEILDLYKVTPKYDLIAHQTCNSLNELISHILLNLDKILDIEKPDLVMVHGDTTTAMASALASFNKNIKIAHVEAGLRTFDMTSPFPEEMNRRFIDSVCSFAFAPTKLAKRNLLKEEIPASNIYVVGNSIIDLVKYNLTLVKHEARASKEKLAILTVHRRENLGNSMENIFKAVNLLLDRYSDLTIVFPMHPNPKIKKLADMYLNKNPRLKIVSPLNPIEFTKLEMACDLVLSDSGGIQEECVYLGKPILVLRNETERPEGLQSNCMIIAGVNTQEIINKFDIVYKNLSSHNYYKSSNVFGEGQTSQKIVDILLQAKL